MKKSKIILYPVDVDIDECLDECLFNIVRKRSEKHLDSYVIFDAELELSEGIDRIILPIIRATNNDINSWR